MIRAMQAADLARVVTIESAVQSHPWRMTQFQEALANYACSVIEHAGQVQGFCILQPVLDEANLLLMAIDPAVQGQGLGYALLDAALQQLPNNPIQVFLEVRLSNIAAIKLYEKAGFHQIDLRKRYYPVAGGGYEDAVIMVKSCSDDFAALFQS